MANSFSHQNLSDEAVKSPTDLLSFSNKAWKPSNLKGDSTTPNENMEMTIFLKQIRLILNKLTPQKFDLLVAQFQNLKIDTDEKLQRSVILLYEKAINEPLFCATYARMCEALKNMNATKDNEVQNKPKKLFRCHLLTKCQQEFQREYLRDLDKGKYHTDILAVVSGEASKVTKQEWQEKELRARRFMLGNIRFIAELYKNNMLTLRIIHECMRKLLDICLYSSLFNLAKDIDSCMEGICTIWSTVGEKLEVDTRNYFKPPKQQISKEIMAVETYFHQIKRLSNATTITARVRFMMLDVIELRERKWQARIKPEEPMKIDELRENIKRKLHDHTSTQRLKC